MSTTELRKRLIEKINITEDKNLLLEATRLMDIQVHDSDMPYQLSDEMNDAVDEALEQISNGEYLTHEGAEKEITEWLEE
jgi:hypothetical protein